MLRWGAGVPKRWWGHISISECIVFPGKYLDNKFKCVMGTGVEGRLNLMQISALRCLDR